MKSQHVGCGNEYVAKKQLEKSIPDFRWKDVPQGSDLDMRGVDLIGYSNGKVSCFVQVKSSKTGAESFMSRHQYSVTVYDRNEHKIYIPLWIVYPTGNTWHILLPEQGSWKEFTNNNN